MIYQVSVSRRTIRHPMHDDIVQNGIDTDVLRVKFDSEWHTLGQCRAVFCNGADKVTTLFEAAAQVDIDVPWEVLRCEGRLFVTFIGYPGEDARVVTRLMDRPFKVAESGRITGDDPTPPTLTEIEYILQAANEALKDARDAKAEADKSADAANAAASAATSASEAATASAGKADASAAKADSAAASANDAASKANEVSSSAKASQDENDRRQAANNAAQAGNDTAQRDNNVAQAKNNSDQAANNLAARESQPKWLGEGEYDPDTLIPTIDNPIEGPLYFVPNPKAKAGGENAYIEWLWRSDKKVWEEIGVSSKQTTPISTDEVDRVFAGEHPTGEQVLDLTGLSYVWAKLSAWATGMFAKLTHIHKASDIASGSVPVNHGGTGSETALGANFNLLDGIPAGGEMTDDDKVAMVHPNPTASTGRIITKTAAQVWSWIKSKGDAVFAAKDHDHDASDVTSGILPLVHGGLGADDAAGARANIGAASQTDMDAVRDSLGQAAVTIFGKDLGDIEVCRRSFVGVHSGYSYKPMFGSAQQMFLVVNVAASTAAYQMAYAYNSHELRFRKREGVEWQDWAKPQ